MSSSTGRSWTVPCKRGGDVSGKDFKVLLQAGKPYTTQGSGLPITQAVSANWNITNNVFCEKPTVVAIFAAQKQTTKQPPPKKKKKHKKQQQQKTPTNPQKVDPELNLQIK